MFKYFDFVQSVRVHVENEAAHEDVFGNPGVRPNFLDLLPGIFLRVGPYHCFVARAIPKRRDKYLFEGKVWIDADDFAVVRTEGHPAKKLSFWIQRADFVRQYQKIDNFWLWKKRNDLC